MSSYELVGNRWPDGTTVLTYSFAETSVNGNAFSGAITDATERAEIQAGFAAWTALTGIKFVEVTDGAVANIRLNFADNQASGKALGLTSLSYDKAGITDPTSSVIMLQDPAEIALVRDASGALYYAQGNQSEDLQTTFTQLALHEIGHVLGFADNSDPRSIENVVLRGDNRTFDQSDLAGAQALYPATAATSLPGDAAGVAAAAQSAAVSTPTATLAPTLFTESQGSTTTAITASAYNGPLSFLSHTDAISYNGSAGINILATANATDPLIASGSGVDLLRGTATGSSVLDAGTNANIVIDGGNGDTTFVQNGYVSGTTWDFVENFHGADVDILFGYVPGISKLTFAESGGLGAATGATVTLQPGQGNLEEATFVGVPLSALHGAAVSIEGVPSWLLWT